MPSGPGSGANYRKFGVFLIVDGASLRGWPLAFFDHPEPWMHNSDQDPDSWLAAALSQCALDVFEDDAAQQIKAFSHQIELYEVWGRGEVALGAFKSSCPAPRSVLVQISDGTLQTLADASVAALAKT